MPVAPTPQQLADIEACREAARRYSHGIDRLDGDYMKSAYWPDAVDDHGTFVGNAWEFVDHCISSHARFAWTMHAITNHSVHLDDDGAHAVGECYNVSRLRWRDSDRLDTWIGRYLDRYEKRDGEWRILHRVCVHEDDRSEVVGETMRIPADRFRQGSEDRGTPGRPIGP